MLSRLYWQRLRPLRKKVQTPEEFRPAGMLAEGKNNLKQEMNGERLSVVYDLVIR